MAVSAVYKLDKIVLPSAVETSQITRSRWDAGIESILERPAGHAHPMFRGTLMQRPKLEFSTTDIGTILGVIGVGGAALGSTSTYMKAAAQVGNVARATTGHKRIVLPASLGYWTQIKLPHNGRAEIDVCLQAQWDGTNDPFVYTASVALSGNLTSPNYFGCGPCSINGSLVPQVQEITIDSGIKLIQAGTASEPWDTFVAVEETAPTVTIKCFSEINWSGLGLIGLALNGSSGLVFYARKYAAGGTRVADATASHIKFIGLNGSAIPVDSNGEGAGLISDTLRVELISASDSVLPLTGTVGSAIT